MRSILKPKAAILLACVWSLSLLAVRVYYSQSTLYGFYVWNLFLAVIPLVVSSALVFAASRRTNGLMLALLFIAWLAFLPNAPYLVTDLIHLEPLPPVPVWYDSVMLGSFAVTGVLLTYLSIADVQGVVRSRFGRIAAALVAYGSLAISGFGIYVGRFLRWNTWDLLMSPANLWREVIQRILHPEAHVQTWAVTVLYGAGLIVGYVVLNSIAGALHPPITAPVAEADREAV